MKKLKYPRFKVGDMVAMREDHVKNKHREWKRWYAYVVHVWPKHPVAVKVKTLYGIEAEVETLRLRKTSMEKVIAEKLENA